MAADFLIRAVVVAACVVLHGADIGYAGGGREEGDAGESHSYPHLTRLLKGASLTLDGKSVNLDRLDTNTTNVSS